MSLKSYDQNICNGVTEMVGRTPMVFLNRVTKGLSAKVGKFSSILLFSGTSRVACKVEYFGPTCSCKDRIGSAMIDNAEKRGLIQRGKSVIVEATSGNMGAALASVCASRSYKLVLVMPSYASIERVSISILT